MEIKKTPIDQISKKQRKLTIADEVEHESKYCFEPALTPEQLFLCWLDPSDRRIIEETHWILYIGKRKMRVPLEALEVLVPYIQPAVDSGVMKLNKEIRHGYGRSMRKVLRKYNLSKLSFSTMSQQVNDLTIGSFQPLYDENAHANRVRNVLHAIKIRYPHVVFGYPECKQSLSCPIGLNEALKKIAMETHQK